LDVVHRYIIRAMKIDGQPVPSISVYWLEMCHPFSKALVGFTLCTAQSRITRVMGYSACPTCSPRDVFFALPRWTLLGRSTPRPKRGN
jgi:hypothetical protein